MAPFDFNTVRRGFKKARTKCRHDQDLAKAMKTTAPVPTMDGSESPPPPQGLNDNLQSNMATLNVNEQQNCRSVVTHAELLMASRHVSRVLQV